MPLRSLAAWGLLLLALPGTLAAQRTRSDNRLPTGFRMEASLALGRPWLGAGSQSYWDPLGTFSAGGGSGITLGYDFGRVGFSAGFLVLGSRIGGHSGIETSLALLGQWRPDGIALGSWRPLVTAGFVRQGVVAGNVEPGETRDDRVPGAGSSEERTVGVVGSGMRLGLAGERRVGNKLAITLGAEVDVASFGTLVDGAYEMSFPGAGLSVTPRIVLGLRWWPFFR